MSIPKSFRMISALILLMAVSACMGKRTIRSENAGSNSGSNTGQDAVAVQAPTSPVLPGTKVGADGTTSRPAICKEAEKACQPDATPRFCELREFDGVVLTQGHNTYAYGAGDCETRKAILVEACNHGWDIKTLSAIKCSADATDHKCPVVPGICTTQFEPSRCSATKYVQTDIAANEPMVAWGANVCVARYELSKRACSRNMNPLSLDGISCESQARYTGDCPPVQPSCDSVDIKASICEVETAAGEQPSIKVSGEGPGLCLARFNLDLHVCMAGLSPGVVSSRVTCRAK